MNPKDVDFNHENFDEIIRQGKGFFTVPVRESELKSEDNPLVDSEDEAEFEKVKYKKAKIEEVPTQNYTTSLKGLKYTLSGIPKPINELEMDDLMLESFWPMANQMKFLTEDGGVRKKLIRPGNGVVVPPLARVSVLYTVILEMADEPMDNQTNVKRPYVFKLGAGSVIPALEIAVLSMECKEISKFFATYDYAYGKLGIIDKVPQESNILIKIEVLSFVEGGQLSTREIWTLGPKERENLEFREIESFAMILSQEAKDMIKEYEDFRGAGNKFRMIIRVLDEYIYGDERETRRVELLFNSFINLAFVLLKRERWAKAAEAAKSAMEIRGAKKIVKKPLFAKAFYRLAKAKLELNKSDEAMEAIIQALDINQDSKIKCLKSEIENRMAEESAAMKVLAQKMFKLDVKK